MSAVTQLVWGRADGGGGGEFEWCGNFRLSVLTAGTAVDYVHEFREYLGGALRSVRYSENRAKCSLSLPPLLGRQTLELPGDVSACTTGRKVDLFYVRLDPKLSCDAPDGGCCSAPLCL